MNRLSILIIFILILFLCSLPQTNLDIWFILKMGELIWQSKSFPLQDPFTYGETHKIIYNQWLSQLIFYLFHKLGGVNFLNIIKGIMGLLTSYLIYLTIFSRTQKVYFSLCSTLFATAILMYYFNLRAQIFTFLFLALTIYIIELYEIKRRKFIILFPLLTTIWSNFHAGYLVGIIYFCIYLAGKIMEKYLTKFYKVEGKDLQRREILFLFTILLFANIFAQINPTFIFNFLYQVEAASSSLIRQKITEWQLFNPTHFLNYSYDVFLLIGVITILFSLYKKNIRLVDLSLWFIFTSGSILVQRYLPLATITCIPIISFYLYKNLSAMVPAGRSLSKNLLINKLNQLPGYIYLSVFSFFLFLYLFTIPFPYKFIRLKQTDLDAKFLPKDGIEFVKLNRLPPRLFNDVDWGGYLLYQLYPKYKVAMDGRTLAVYKDGYFDDCLKILLEANRKIKQEFFQKYQVNFIFIKKYRPLAKELLKDKDWLLIYEDDFCMIFIKSTKKNNRLIKAMREDRLVYPKSAAFYLFTGYKYLSQNNDALAEKFLKKALKLNSHLSEGWNNLGVIYIRQSKFKEAEKMFKKAIKNNKKNRSAYLNLAHLYMEKGDYMRAIPLYKKVLELDPNNIQAKTILGRIE